MEKIILIDSPCGTLGIAAADEAVTGIFFGGIPADAQHSDRGKAQAEAGTETPASGKVLPVRTGREIPEVAGEKPKEAIPPLLVQAARELGEYFAGTRRTFTFPIRAHGTPFQQEVWRALQNIPYGETRTYGQIAAQIGRPKAVRAVGMANHRNPLPIVVPCHRVVGADGSLTGYAGGLGIKTLLLRLEKQ